jgi:hypothetical protein
MALVRTLATAEAATADSVTHALVVLSKENEKMADDLLEKGAAWYVVRIMP